MKKILRRKRKPFSAQKSKNPEPPQGLKSNLARLKAMIGGILRNSRQGFGKVLEAGRKFCETNHPLEGRFQAKSLETLVLFEDEIFVK
jgi:hypothetical protein